MNPERSSDDAFENLYGIMDEVTASKLARAVSEFRRKMNRDIKNRTRNYFDFSQ